MYDIENEVRAIDKLCKGSAPNIVTVFRHGDLDFLHYIFIDMEICAYSLQEYMYKGNELWTLLELPQYGDPLIVQFAPTWQIMHDISCAVQYIHINGFVHRDVKPSNSMWPARPLPN
jgi:serine/threonine protein kinase